MPTVKYGSTVLVHYTAMLKNGKVIESTAGGDPLRLTVGAGKFWRAFEGALEGMSAGESRKVTIPPEKAFGRREPGGVSSFSRDTKDPIGDTPTEMQHQVVNRGTAEEFCIISTDRGVDLDTNPHLAGEEIVIEIDLVEIENT